MALRVFTPRSYRTTDEGISLLEVVVSMVILSIVAAFVASFVAGSLRTITRSEATATAAIIAQEQLDRLLAVPIRQWGFETDGKTLKTDPVTEDVKGKDGLTYKVTRQLTQNVSNLDVKDACPAVVGNRTSTADIILLKITVNTNTGTFKDSYSTSTYIARDGNATFLKSSVTVRFNVVRGKTSMPYTEGRDGDPIKVDIKDHYRNSRGEGADNNLSGLTRGGCITFLELKGKSPFISFDLGEYRLPDEKQQYSGKFNMISGGHRELVFDISRTAKVQVIPDVVGVEQQRCDDPRLIRMRTPIAAPKNRALKDLLEIAEVSQAEVARIESISEARRTPGQKAMLLSHARWQYYLVCQGSDRKFRGRDFRHWYLLPDTIPISIVEGGDIRPVGRWSGTSFAPVSWSNGLLEEGEWPVVLVDNPKVGGENQAIFAGSCLMQDNDSRAKPYKLTKSFLNNAMVNPGRVHLPLWTIPLEGWYKARHPDRSLNGYLPLVIKNLNDKVQTPNMYGDSRIAGLNQSWFSGCNESPVFDVGWLKSIEWNTDFAQMRLAMPFGLYTYAIYNPSETEEVNGLTVTRSRNSCFPQKRSDRYAGERACLPSGATRVTLYQTDVRTAYRPSFWGGSGNSIYRTRYFDWLDPEKGPYPLPRGPILDACEANPNDYTYCDGSSGKDPADNKYYDGPDDDHAQGQVPGFGVTPGGQGGGNTGGGNTGGGNTGGGGTSDPNKRCTIIDEYGREIPVFGAQCDQHTTTGPSADSWRPGPASCYRKEGKRYINSCTGRSGRYPNGNGRGRRPKEGTWEDSEQCWMVSPRDDDDGYNYCTDYLEKDKYDD